MGMVGSSFFLIEYKNLVCQTPSIYLHNLKLLMSRDLTSPIFFLNVDTYNNMSQNDQSITSILDNISHKIFPGPCTIYKNLEQEVYISG